MNKRVKPEQLDLAARDNTEHQDGIAPPTPHEQRNLLVNGTSDFLVKCESVDPAKAPQIAAESVDAAIAKGVVTLKDHDADERDALAPPPASGDVATIPLQYGIQVCGVVGGGVELRQEGQHLGFDDPEADSIAVTSGNVVELARKILNVAGFPDVVIQAGHRGDEIDNGRLASEFDFTPPKPYVRPAQSVAPPPPPAPEPAYDPWDDREALLLNEQKATACYLNNSNALVIRQMDDDDTTVIVVAANVPALQKRIAELYRGDHGAGGA